MARSAHSSPIRDKCLIRGLQVSSHDHLVVTARRNLKNMQLTIPWQFRDACHSALKIWTNTTLFHQGIMESDDEAAINFSHRLHSTDKRHNMNITMTQSLPAVVPADEGSPRGTQPCHSDKCTECRYWSRLRCLQDLTKTTFSKTSNYWFTSRWTACHLTCWVLIPVLGGQSCYCTAPHLTN